MLMNGEINNQLPASQDGAPFIHVDPVVESYKKDVDRTLLRENLKLTSEDRSRKFERNMKMIYELRRAGRERRIRSQAEP
jgi:hypothetical protein